MQATGVESGTPDVFISYASQDATVADAVVSALEHRGLKCWIAPRNVTPGAFYADEIVHALDATKAIVLILSHNAAASPHVLREVERAASKRHPVISLRLDQAPLPAGLEYFLNTSQWLDASGEDFARSMPKLIDAVRVAVQAPVVNTEAAPMPRAPAPTWSVWSSKRTAIMVASLIGLAIGGFAIDRLWESSRKAVPAPARAPAAAAISEKSIAVLPFTDMSETKDQEYFSDGMAEEIIDLLVKMPELKVPARTSSFYFKGKSTQIPEIARELGVAHVLEGSVRKSGTHLRVTALLVRADNGYHLWSETYDRQLDDVFKLQDEIATAVVKSLKVSLLEGKPPSENLTVSSKAYMLYLQALALINQGSEDDTLKAYAYLKQAVSVDPKFALAWATLASLLTRDNVDWGRVFNPAEPTRQQELIDLQQWGSIWAQARAAAHAAAEEAVKLAPDLAESHAAKAQVLAWLDWDWAAADGELQRSRELEPSNARVTTAAADIAIELGRVSDGLRLANQAAVLDPLGLDALNTIEWGQYVSGASNEAEISSRRLIDLYPTASHAHFHYALVLLARGEPQAALAEFQLEKMNPFRVAGVPLALDALGRRSEADSAIAIAEQEYGNGMAYQIAYIYASRKDLDRTFFWLERAYRQHDGGLSELKIDPMFSSLGHDQRYKALLRKMRLPE